MTAAMILRGATAYSIPDLLPSPQIWGCLRGAEREAGALMPSGTHGRWTALLLMAELSVGHASFGEPRWTLLPFGRRWVLMWNCRRCGRSTWTPADHRAAHLDADRVRLARMQSFGPLRDA